MAKPSTVRITRKQNEFMEEVVKQFWIQDNGRAFKPVFTGFEHLEGTIGNALLQAYGVWAGGDAAISRLRHLLSFFGDSMLHLVVERSTVVVKYNGEDWDMEWGSRAIDLGAVNEFLVSDQALEVLAALFPAEVNAMREEEKRRAGS